MNTPLINEITFLAIIITKNINERIKKFKLYISIHYEYTDSLNNREVKALVTKYYRHPYSADKKAQFFKKKLL